MAVFCIHVFTVRYSDIPLEDIQRSCPACRGTCNCRVCLRRDNLVKVIHIKSLLQVTSLSLNLLRNLWLIF